MTFLESCIIYSYIRGGGGKRASRVLPVFVYAINGDLRLFMRRVSVIRLFHFTFGARTRAHECRFFNAFVPEMYENIFLSLLLKLYGIYF